MSLRTQRFFSIEPHMLVVCGRQIAIIGIVGSTPPVLYLVPLGRPDTLPSPSRRLALPTTASLYLGHLTINRSAHVRVQTRVLDSVGPII